MKKKKPTKWEKILANNNSDKRLCPKYIRNSCSLTAKTNKQTT